MENFHAQVAVVDLGILGNESNPLLDIVPSTTFNRFLAE